MFINIKTTTRTFRAVFIMVGAFVCIGIGFVCNVHSANVYQASDVVLVDANPRALVSLSQCFKDISPFIFSSQCGFDKIDFLFSEELVRQFVWVNNLSPKMLRGIQNSLVYLQNKEDTVVVSEPGMYEVWLYYNPRLPTDNPIGRRRLPLPECKVRIAGQDLVFKSNRELHDSDIYTTWFTIGDIYDNWFRLGQVSLDDQYASYKISSDDPRLQKQLKVVLVHKEIIENKRKEFYSYLLQHQVDIAYLFKKSSQFFAKEGKFFGRLELMPAVEYIEMVGYQKSFESPVNSEEVFIDNIGIDIEDFPFVEVSAKRIGETEDSMLYLLAGIDTDDIDEEIDCWVQVPLRKFPTEIQTVEHALLEEVLNQMGHRKNYTLQAVKFFGEHNSREFAIEEFIIKRKNCVLVNKKKFDIKADITKQDDDVFALLYDHESLVINVREPSNKGENRFTLRANFENYDFEKFPYIALTTEMLSNSTSISRVNVTAGFDVDGDGREDYLVPVKARVITVSNNIKVVELDIQSIGESKQYKDISKAGLPLVNFYLDFLLRGSILSKQDILSITKGFIYAKAFPRIQDIMKSDGDFLKETLFSINDFNYSLSDLEDFRLETQNIAMAKFKFRIKQKTALNKINFSPNGPFLVRWLALEHKKAEGKNESISTMEKIQFRKINPTLYAISMDIDGGRWLIFNENFHHLWNIYFSGETGAPSNFLNIFGYRKQVANKYHFVVNGYANSWYVPTEEAIGKNNLYLALVYEPQKLLLIGAFISIITFVGVSAACVMNGLKRNNRNN